MSLFALTLSACVGSVTLPAGTIAESKTEKTDDSLDPKSITIDDKEPEPIVDNKEPEPIAVADKEPEKQIAIDRQPENPCLANPFEPTCGAGFASARAIVINKCIVGNTAQADPTCGQAVAGTNGCITDPFLSGCDENPFFTKHVKIAKDNRVIFCNYLYNAGDNHCTGSDSIADICTHDPFSRLCNNDYDNAREMTCESEPNSARCTITTARICDRNPFISFCDSDYDNVRESACKRAPKSSRCTITTARVCAKDSLSSLCVDHIPSYPAQERACLDNPTYILCLPTTNRICSANPLSSWCNGLVAYYPAQKMACESTPNSPRCAPIIARLITWVCDLDSLDALCTGNDIYYPAQKMACIYHRNKPRCEATIERVCGTDSLDSLCEGNRNYFSAQKTACMNDKTNPRCYLTFERVCYDSPFDAFCDGHGAREATCRDDNTDPRCTPTIVLVCTANPFDSLCDNNEAYYSAKETACADEPNSYRCAPTIERVCGVNVFGSLCQSSYLTHLPPLNSGAYFDSTNDIAPYARCYFPNGNYRCGFYVPQVNIKPLNNTNTGTATYAGSVSVQYATNHHGQARNAHYKPALTQNIDIIVNFGDKTLSYSGNLEYNPFRINGNFTDRGILTGTVSFNTNEAPLYGLIGQDETIGVFSNVSRGVGSFAGGFIATRE